MYLSNKLSIMRFMPCINFLIQYMFVFCTHCILKLVKFSHFYSLFFFFYSFLYKIQYIPFLRVFYIPTQLPRFMCFFSLYPFNSLRARDVISKMHQ